MINNELIEVRPPSAQRHDQPGGTMHDSDLHPARKYGVIGSPGQATSL